MSRRKAISGSIITVDLKFLGTIHALQSSEALKRDLRRASHKLQELGPVCLVERAQGPPEPLDLNKRNSECNHCNNQYVEHYYVDSNLDGAGLVFVVLSVSLEVVNVNRGQARDEQLQLLFSEDGDQPFGDDFIEALKESCQLFADCT